MLVPQVSLAVVGARLILSRRRQYGDGHDSPSGTNQDDAVAERFFSRPRGADHPRSPARTGGLVVRRRRYVRGRLHRAMGIREERLPQPRGVA